MVSSVGATASRAEEAFRMGAVQVLPKPFEPEQLESLIELELERKRDGARGRS
jgi:DNA-binding NtrC family response regulator